MCQKKSKTVVVRGILCDRIEVNSQDCNGCYFLDKNCLRDIPLSICEDNDGTEYILKPKEI